MKIEACFEDYDIIILDVQASFFNIWQKEIKEHLSDGKFITSFTFVPRGYVYCYFNNEAIDSEAAMKLVIKNETENQRNKKNPI